MCRVCYFTRYPLTFSPKRNSCFSKSMVRSTSYDSYNTEKAKLLRMSNMSFSARELVGDCSPADRSVPEPGFQPSFHRPSCASSVQLPDDRVDICAAEARLSQVLQEPGFVFGGVPSHRQPERQQEVVDSSKVLPN